MQRLTSLERDALLAFLERGVLGPVRLGMSKAEVVERVGPARDTRTIYEPFEINHYGEWLELTFDDSVLEYISLRYKWQKIEQKRLRLPPIWGASWCHAVATWTPLRFRDFLWTHGRTFRRVHGLPEDRDLSFVVPSRGTINFDLPERMGLHSIGVSSGDGFPFGANKGIYHALPPALRWPPRAGRRRSAFT